MKNRANADHLQSVAIISLSLSEEITCRMARLWAVNPEE